MITENLSTLKIHKLTKEQYNMAVENGSIDENAIYLTPDEGVDSAYVHEALDEAIAPIDEKIGDIDLALDNIIAIQENLIGGDG